MSLSDKNWFERNSKKTICALLVAVLIFIGYGVEKILAYRSQGRGFNFALPYRAIRLSEFRPLMSIYIYPDEAEKKGYCDGWSPGP